MNALIVEPSLTYQLILKEFMQDYAITHDDVMTGESALSMLSENTYQLVFVSMQLPDMNAIELARKIKAQVSLQNCIVIVLSGEEDTDKLEQMKVSEVDFVCQKKSFEKLKIILAKLTQDELVICSTSGSVLYIEDHLTLAKLTITILKSMGLQVDHFVSAERGLEAIDVNDYDLLLLDIILAGEKDGIVMIEEIRSRKDDKQFLPILAMSASLNISQRIYALKVGANDFIVKPVMQAELAARVKSLVVARQLYKQVTAQKVALETMALTDQLTGLNNRYYLNQVVIKSLSAAKRHHHPLCLMMIDLDKFKLINDTLGHEKGDEVLVEIAKILKKTCRKEDTSVRFGGDEFILVLPLCSIKQGIKKAESIRMAVTKLSITGITSKLTLSVGISSTEQGFFIFDELFNLADKAVYKAKAKGGNNTQWLEDVMLQEDGFL
ncbi:MAG: diguanylate cyclase [Colwellia sp.]